MRRNFVIGIISVHDPGDREFRGDHQGLGPHRGKSPRAFTSMPCRASRWRSTPILSRPGRPDRRGRGAPPRKNLEDESGFFGAMDGASKFVRGDAIGRPAVVFINVIGGMIIGIAQQGLPFAEPRAPNAAHRRRRPGHAGAGADRLDGGRPPGLQGGRTAPPTRPCSSSSPAIEALGMSGAVMVVDVAPARHSACCRSCCSAAAPAPWPT